MRLLLAEDERELSDALCAILKHNHYSVDPVYDGQDALDYLRHGQYDGAILDIMMPKIDGLSVLHRVRQRERCRGGRKAGNEAGEKPEGPCAGLRCCADRRMRGLLREAGAGKRPLNHKICTEPLARSV